MLIELDLFYQRLRSTGHDVNHTNIDSVADPCTGSNGPREGQGCAQSGADEWATQRQEPKLQWLIYLLSQGVGAVLWHSPSTLLMAEPRCTTFTRAQICKCRKDHAFRLTNVRASIVSESLSEQPSVVSSLR